ncbi:sulfatase family protein [Paenibacillus glycanilyticus]|uniref:Arylsulfatase n=1 Tax=Paenibacillus glycanilyticus TaxID=126569 RepID=A0ABQ6GM37_9BACL|nr:sulfatase-like hydrolase/transferase [Paenibacillus glycanilyticus]GLX70667.1 arylsulfatase [Paenibacillus glycanilyticus]
MTSGKPNILWICTDQQRYDTLGCYGNEWVNTPHIDSLARTGVQFDHAYCQSPVCTPSRSSFMTGRYPRTTRCRANGQNIPADEKLISRLLADEGYTCGLSGKLHLSACHPSVNSATERRIDDGFHQFFWSHHPMSEWPTNEYTQWLKQKGKTFQAPHIEGSKHVQTGPDAEDHQTTWCAEKAVQFIETNADYDKPWFFICNMFDPHHPFDPPKAYLDKYLARLDEIPLPKYKEGELEGKPLYQRIDHEGAYGMKGHLPFSEMDNNDHRLLKAAYWAMVDLIDEQVGRMLEALKQSGQLDNTIVVFMSDHGELLGDHGMYLKGPHFYECSVRVPLIVSWPGYIQGGRRNKQLVELVDLAPTLLDAAGIKVYEGMQGKSLWPYLSANIDTLHREDIYCESNDANFKHNQRSAWATMLRTATHKLVVYHGDSLGELYDLEDDPDEFNNLWHDPAYIAVKLELMNRLCDRMAFTVDPLPPRVAPW